MLGVPFPALALARIGLRLPRAEGVGDLGDVWIRLLPRLGDEGQLRKQDVP